MSENDDTKQTTQPATSETLGFLVSQQPTVVPDESRPLNTYANQLITNIIKDASETANRNHDENLDHANELNFPQASKQNPSDDTTTNLDKSEYSTDNGLQNGNDFDYEDIQRKMHGVIQDIQSQSMTDINTSRKSVTFSPLNDDQVNHSTPTISDPSTQINPMESPIRSMSEPTLVEHQEPNEQSSPLPIRQDESSSDIDDILGIKAAPTSTTVPFDDSVDQHQTEQENHTNRRVDDNDDFFDTKVATIDDNQRPTSAIKQENLDETTRFGTTSSPRAQSPSSKQSVHVTPDEPSISSDEKRMEPSRSKVPDDTGNDTDLDNREVADIARRPSLARSPVDRPRSPTPNDSRKMSTSKDLPPSIPVEQPQSPVLSDDRQKRQSIEPQTVIPSTSSRRESITKTDQQQSSRPTSGIQTKSDENSFEPAMSRPGSNRTSQFQTTDEQSALITPGVQLQIPSDDFDSERINSPPPLPKDVQSLVLVSPLTDSSLAQAEQDRSRPPSETDQKSPTTSMISNEKVIDGDVMPSRSRRESTLSQQLISHTDQKPGSRRGSQVIEQTPQISSSRRESISQRQQDESSSHQQGGSRRTSYVPQEPTSPRESVLPEPQTSSPRESITNEQKPPSRRGSIASDQQVLAKRASVAPEERTPSRRGSIADEPKTTSRKGSFVPEQHTASRRESIHDEPKIASRKGSTTSEQQISHKRESPVPEQQSSGRRESIQYEQKTSSRRESITDMPQVSNKRESVSPEQQTSSRRLSIMDEQKTSARRDSTTVEQKAPSREGSAASEQQVPSKRPSTVAPSHISNRRESIADEQKISSRKGSTAAEEQSSSRRGSIYDDQKIASRKESPAPEPQSSSRRGSIYDDQKAASRKGSTAVEQQPSSRKESPVPEPQSSSRRGSIYDDQKVASRKSSTAVDRQPSSRKESPAPEPQSSSRRGSIYDDQKAASRKGSTAVEQQPSSRKESPAPEPQISSRRGSIYDEQKVASRKGSTAVERQPSSRKESPAPEPQAPSRRESHIADEQTTQRRQSFLDQQEQKSSSKPVSRKNSVAEQQQLASRRESQQPASPTHRTSINQDNQPPSHHRSSNFPVLSSPESSRRNSLTKQEQQSSHVRANKDSHRLSVNIHDTNNVPQRTSAKNKQEHTSSIDKRQKSSSTTDENNHRRPSFQRRSEQESKRNSHLMTDETVVTPIIMDSTKSRPHDGRRVSTTDSSYDPTPASKLPPVTSSFQQEKPRHSETLNKQQIPASNQSNNKHVASSHATTASEDEQSPHWTKQIRIPSIHLTDDDASTPREDQPRPQSPNVDQIAERNPVPSPSLISTSIVKKRSPTEKKTDEQKRKGQHRVSGRSTSADSIPHIPLVDDKSLDSTSENNTDFSRRQRPQIKQRKKDVETNTDQIFDSQNLLRSFFDEKELTPQKPMRATKPMSDHLHSTRRRAPNKEIILTTPDTMPDTDTPTVRRTVKQTKDSHQDKDPVHVNVTVVVKKFAGTSKDEAPVTTAETIVEQKPAQYFEPVPHPPESLPPATEHKEEPIERPKSIEQQQQVPSSEQKIFEHHDRHTQSDTEQIMTDNQKKRRRPKRISRTCQTYECVFRRMEREQQQDLRATSDTEKNVQTRKSQLRPRKKSPKKNLPVYLSAESFKLEELLPKQFHQSRRNMSKSSSLGRSVSPQGGKLLILRPTLPFHHTDAVNVQRVCLQYAIDLIPNETLASGTMAAHRNRPTVLRQSDQTNNLPMISASSSGVSIPMNRSTTKEKSASHKSEDYGHQRKNGGAV